MEEEMLDDFDRYDFDDDLIDEEGIEEEGEEEGSSEEIPITSDRVEILEEKQNDEKNIKEKKSKAEKPKVEAFSDTKETPSDKKRKQADDKTPVEEKQTPAKKTKQEEIPTTPKENGKSDATKKETQTPAKQTPAKREEKTPAKTPKGKIEMKEPEVRKLPNGLQIEDLVIGEGEAVPAGKKVFVKYKGTLTNGKVFDSALKSPFMFRLGAQQVIKGWDIGVKGMRKGGKRRLTIPPPLAYGPKGAPPAIPGNSTLIFEVELVDWK